MSKFDIDPELVKKLSDLLEEKNLAEIEYAQGDQSIRVTKHVEQTAVVAAQPQTIIASPANTPGAAPQDAAEQLDGNVITAPMVGTVYLAPSPDAPNFIKVGDTVKEGDTLLIIEAMKVMNQIKANASGKISAIFVDNEEPIEFGQNLVVIQ